MICVIVRYTMASHDAVVRSRSTVSRRYRLAVDAGGAGRLVAARGAADPGPQGVVDFGQRAVDAPAAEVLPDGTLGREVLGQEPPLTAGPGDVEDGVEHGPHRRLTRP